MKNTLLIKVVLVIGIICQSFSLTAQVQCIEDELNSNADCPVTVKEWDNYKINNSNFTDYINCFELLKQSYKAKNPIEDLTMEDMHSILLTGYEKVIPYCYGDGDCGDCAKAYRKEFEALKSKKPPKTKAKVSKPDKTKSKDKEDATDDGNV